MIADKSITTAFESISAGDTEFEIAGALTGTLYAEGAQDFKLLIIATGERSVFPNVGPTDRVLKTNDICRVEVFPNIRGYYAGVCRTAVVGQPTAEQEKIWANLIECKYLVMDMIKPGARCKWFACRSGGVLLEPAECQFGRCQDRRPGTHSRCRARSGR